VRGKLRYYKGKFHPDGINGKIKFHPGTICLTYGVNGVGGVNIADVEHENWEKEGDNRDLLVPPPCLAISDVD